MDLHLVSHHWAKKSAAMAADPSYWVNNYIVADYVHALITSGKKQHWLPWLFEDYLEKRYFPRLLSLCSGDGSHEIQVYHTGQVGFIRGFDISMDAVTTSVEHFRNAGAPEHSYLFDVQDGNQFTVREGPFDLILSTGALHHLTNLEHAVSEISSLLTEDGYFVAVEYIGPNRFQWTEKQIDIINSILHSLDSTYLKEGRIQPLIRPSIETMKRTDPSEAVRSRDIEPILMQTFHVEYKKYYNGAIIHQLYPLLNPTFTNANDRGFDSLLRTVLLLEDILTKEEILEPDFVFMVCRKKQELHRTTIPLHNP